MLNMLSDPIFWVIVLNIVGFVLGHFLCLSKNLRNTFFKYPKFFHKAFVIIFFMLPICILPFLRQPRIEFRLWLLIIGIISIVVAITIEVLAICKIGIVPGGRPKEEKKLLTTGIYGVIRHPIYSGTIFVALGLFIILRAKYAIIYMPVLIILYIMLAIAEDKSLIEDYGEEYKEYKKTTKWRLFPYLF